MCSTMRRRSAASMFELTTYRRGTSPVVYCDTSTREACVYENSVQAVDENSNRGSRNLRGFDKVRSTVSSCERQDLPTQYFHTSPRQWLGSRRHLMRNLLSHTEFHFNNCAQLSILCRGAWGVVVCCPFLAGSINTLNACII